jgi:predicted transglutaminase-like cysteine proteinase
MKFLILLIVMLSSLFGDDFISVKSDDYFVKNRINYVNAFVNEMKGETNTSVIISKVNSFCNEFTYTSDMKMYGKSDYWATPVEFITNGGGDCEDFVVIKYEILKSLGIKDMLFATKKVNGVLHAVLLVKNSSGTVVTLDNMRNIVYSEDTTTLKISDMVKTMSKKFS